MKPKHFLYPNPQRSWWLFRYNALVSKIKSGKLEFPKDSWLGKHHVIPRSERPDLEKDERNIVVLPFAEHIDLHYFLWRAEPTNKQKAALFNKQMLEWSKKAGKILADSVVNCLRELAVNALKAEMGRDWHGPAQVSCEGRFTLF